MSSFTTQLRRTKRQWELSVTTPAGEKLEYRYGSEREARYFAAIFELGPSFVPTLKRRRASAPRARASAH